MEQLAIGTLAEKDQDAVDEKMEVLQKKDPYAKEPRRNESLKAHSDQPMNAEVPGNILTQQYLTPHEV